MFLWKDTCIIRVYYAVKHITFESTSKQLIFLRSNSHKGLISFSYRSAEKSRTYFVPPLFTFHKTFLNLFGLYRSDLKKKLIVSTGHAWIIDYWGKIPPRLLWSCDEVSVHNNLTASIFKLIIKFIVKMFTSLKIIHLSLSLLKRVKQDSHQNKLHINSTN